MAVFTTPFGNGVLVGSGGNVVENVHNQFGPRDTGGTVGVNKVEGIKEELIFDFTGEMFNDLPDGLKPFVLPAGAVIKSVYIDVEEVFVVTGTNPTVLIGTDGSEVTNGFVISEAVLEATGSANLTSTLTGTWDGEAPLAANTTIGIALGGTGTPAITDAGKARISILFERINRAPSPAVPGGPVLP
jgi:hypothetical protein